jgi:hypothetical protein
VVKVGALAGVRRGLGQDAEAEEEHRDEEDDGAVTDG